MNVGDTVKIDKCDVCSAVVGKTAKVVSLGKDTVRLNFGRGRPQKDRPTFHDKDDVSLVTE